MASLGVVELIGRIQTNRDGRTALEVCETHLQRAYGLIDLFPAQTPNLRAYVDSVRSYVNGVYATVPDDDEEIAWATSARVGLAMQQTDDVLRSVENLDASLYPDLLGALGNALPRIGTAIGNTLGGIAAAPAAALSGLFWPIAIVLVAVVGFGFLRSRGGVA